MSLEQFITEHLDLWTSAVTSKSTGGRGSNGKTEFAGIQKLRALILELAVRGKLVPQNSDDEPALDLLHRIVSQTTETAKTKNASLSEPISTEEIPYDKPFCWEWSRLGAVSSYIQRGKGPKYADSGAVRVISQKCIQWTGLDLSRSRFVADQSLDSYKPERFLKSRDILWNSTGTGTVGRLTCVSNLEGSVLVADSHVTIIRLHLLNERFISAYLSSPTIQHRIDPHHPTSLVSGTTKQVELNTSSVKSLVVPIPPISEQHRIVQKVDELMALCDRLEQQSRDQHAAHETLVDALLDTLTQSKDADELAENWARLAAHFDTLFTTENSIERLKRTVQQLAVIGRLTHQSQRDEPASELLRKIASEKQELLRRGLIKKPRRLPSPRDEEKTFPLPSGWALERLENIFNIIVDCPHSTPKFVSTGKPCLDTNSFKEGRLLTSKVRYVPDEVFTFRNSRLAPRARDIVFAREGSVGESVVIPEGVTCCLGQRVMLFRPSKLLNASFLRMALSSPYVLTSLLSLHKGIGAKHVNVGDMREYSIALPPASEQDRIVERVNELFAVCDKLKTRSAQSSDTRRQIANAVVEQAIH